MIAVLSIGSCVIATTMVLSTVFFEIASEALEARIGRYAASRRRLIALSALLAALFWILVVVTLSVWIWALVYYALGLFDTLEPALYFAIVSFTTVGYGDLVLDAEWRLLAGMTATNGLLVFGLFTAFLVDVMKDLRRIKRR
ncbi:potassium channel family protein [Sulfitobacter sabulilitoris]|uniref:Two pore domain potassium channel family protein n=1 Tax=Sulfitobacter sabulilitoris TaxID=2562655 RepID=A0A5S3PBZ5_9RHOB|nr:potassium channel family protein [Sulfitobacter sabulilitoris]TMM51212.1 two pore domain potassium channel family protein [Sulfitobacter sabulilitoris]